MGPVFEEVASSYPGLLFLTVDVDEVKVKPPPPFNLMLVDLGFLVKCF